MQLTMCAAVILIWAWASSESYDNSLAKAEKYKRMVCAGVWRPYKGKPDCSTAPVRADVY